MSLIRPSARGVTPGTADARGDPDEATYRRIYDSIYAQELPPGTRLREDRLGKIFGVSRARIRRVLARLAHEGVVQIEANRGASVARPSKDEARHLFAARRTIEGAIVREVARRFGAKEKSALSKHVNKERAAEVQADRGEMIRLSGEFHLLLVELSENTVLKKFLREVIARESLVIVAYERPGRPSCSHHEHREILDALVQKDAERAAGLMLKHLENVEDRLDLDRARDGAVDLERVFATKARP